MAETAEERVERNKAKTCVLKASIHCEGCKRKVKKILSQLQGVEFVDVDTQQQKVTVIGSVDADTLIKKLVKSGKHAQLWPQNPHKINNSNNNNIIPNGKIKEKSETEEETPTKIHHHQQPNPSTSNKAAKEPQPLESPAKSSEGSVGIPEGGATKINEETGGGDSGCAVPAPAKAINGEPPVKTSGGAHEEAKPEEKKGEEGCSAAGEPPQAVEKKEEAVGKTNGGGGEANTGTSGKKKKKKGQSGNLSASAPSSAFRESENRESGSPQQANHNIPRDHHNPTPHHYYTPPPQPQPVYAVSYNTAYPTSSYTASYYPAPPPPYSYAYTHQGPETVLPPSDAELRPRQPLDSFEIFSDENPNGCSVV